MFRSIAILVPTILVVASIPALGAPLVEDSAVVNGDFELAAFQARPAACLLFGDGYVNVFQPGNPYGLPWLFAISPCHSSYVTALGWSHGAGAVYDDFDGDEDREAKILPGMVDPQTGSHNMWQAYTAPHQAWMAGESYEFRVEQGTIPAGAATILYLSKSPHTTPNAFMFVQIECGLVLPSTLMTPDADGLVHMHTTDGDLVPVLPSCNGLAAEWPGATHERRHEILDGLRLVQNSFVNFNAGTEAVVIDDVAMYGAETVAEAAVPDL